jgi:hypothetical protein
MLWQGIHWIPLQELRGKPSGILFSKPVGEVALFVVFRPLIATHHTKDVISILSIVRRYNDDNVLLEDAAVAIVIIGIGPTEVAVGSVWIVAELDFSIVKHSSLT